MHATEICMHFIYKITNLVNGKIYIGQTKDLSSRWSDHKYKAKKIGSSSRQLVTRAIAKYGSSNFIFEPIATCLTQDSSNDAERQIISQNDATNSNIGYNISAGGDVFPPTKEMIVRRSSSLKRYYLFNNHHFKGKNLSESHKKAISVSSIGKVGTNNGKIFSDSWKRKISKSAKKERENQRRFDPATELEICRKYSISKSFRQLAKDYCCYPTLIKAVLIRNNVDLKNHTNKISNGRNKFTESQEKEICNIYLNETSNKSEIARRFGIKANTITGILFRNGALKGESK